MYFINLPLINEIDFNERFDLQKFVQMQDDVYDLLDSYFATKIKELPQYGITTLSGEEHRPDLLSYRLYKNTGFWYILMVYNDYISAMDMKEGATIIYPSISDIETLYFKLNSLQKNQIISGVL